MRLNRYVLKTIGLFAIFVMLLSNGTPLSTVYGQDSTDCEFDVSEATALLSKAQAKASSGDVPAALDMLDQVEQNLSDIKQRCSTAVMDVTLSETFEDPTGRFTINYPKDWLAHAIEGADTGEEKTTPILFANMPEAFEVLADSEAHPTAQGVVVYISNARNALIQLGGFKDIDYSNMNAENLLKAIIAGSNITNATFEAPERTKALGDYETAEATFTYYKSNKTTVVSEGNLLIMRLSSDQYAVVLGFGPVGQQKSIAALSRAMAETLRYTGKSE